MKARSIWSLVVASAALATFADTTTEVGIMWSEYAVLRGIFAGAMVAALGFAIIGSTMSFYNNYSHIAAT